MKLDMKMMVLNNNQPDVLSPTPEISSIVNGEKLLGNWNPRSLQTFQTFPRSPLSANGLKNGKHENGMTNGNGHGHGHINGTNGTSEEIRPRHGHSQSVIESMDPKIISRRGSATNNGDSSAPAAPTPVHSHSKSALEPIDLHKVVIHSDGSRDVRIFLGTNDRRFGFSVVGGTDEGFNPYLDDISAGSPADRADLEIGDEILEVNGRSLSNCSHTEVISHIHQCIRSRTICLRVKRKSGNRLALDLAQQSNIQDAFVIAVEQQARERLERLSALKKIKPVDMNKLSQQLNLKDSTVSVDVHASGAGGAEVGSNDGKAGDDQVNGLVDATNPVYNISVPDLTAHQTKAANSKPTANARSSSTVLANGRGPNVGAELKNKTDASIGDQQLPNGHSEVLLRKQDERVLVNSVGQSTRTPSEVNDQDSAVLRTKTPDDDKKEERVDPSKTQRTSEVAKTKTEGASAAQPPLPFNLANAGNMISLVELDGGPHREMAVDVPEGFMARTKTPPRYPPPRSAMTTSKKNGGVGKPPPPPREVASASKVQKPAQRSSIISRSTAAASPAPSSGTGSVTSRHRPTPGGIMASSRSSDQVDATITSPAPNLDQIERIKKYQEDMARRREEEARRQREEEFLRSSLRGSEKLKALEEPRTPTPTAVTLTNDPGAKGAVNAAFAMDDDGPHERHPPQAQHGHHQPQQHPVARPAYREDVGRVVGVSELLECIGRLQHQLRGKHRDSPDINLSSLQQLVKSTDFQRVLAVHNKVQSIWCFGCPPTPISDDVQGLVQECVEALEESGLPEAMDLVSVLHNHDLVGLAMAHDEIARREPLPPVSPEEELLDRASHYPESDSVKIVRIEKTNEPLGATIKNESDAVVIGRIVKGGAAERSGLLREGDEILEVNGVEMRGKNVNEVCDILATMTGTLTFLISPTSHIDRSHIRTNTEPVMHVKAHFDYDPEEDLYIPCRELGISFQKGDILHVLSQEDPNWWQAYREGEEDQSLAGLIPSKSFQEQQESLKQAQFEESSNRKSKKSSTLLCARKQAGKNKRKKKLYSAANDDFEAEEILTYEEVGLYYPRANRKRPMVLIGPPNIGRMQLVQMLMERDPDRFATAVAHTSRPRRDSEVDGRDHHFITRIQFEADILSRKFVDHGEFERHYYGTSLDAIRCVVNTGKICVCSFHPQSLKNLKTSDLKPFVVFIAPPNLETLKKNRQKMGLSFKDEELKEIIEKARETERKYGHYLDFTLVNVDLERTYQQLIHEINVMEREPQWVPAAWLNNEDGA